MKILALATWSTRGEKYCLNNVLDLLVFVSRDKVRRQATSPPKHSPFMAVSAAAFEKRQL